jgi:hypothetical protein
MDGGNSTLRGHSSKKKSESHASFHPPFPPITNERRIVIVIWLVAVMNLQLKESMKKESMNRQRRFLTFALLALSLLTFEQTASAQTAQVTGIISRDRRSAGHAHQR